MKFPEFYPQKRAFEMFPWTFIHFPLLSVPVLVFFVIHGIQRGHFAQESRATSLKKAEPVITRLDLCELFSLLWPDMVYQAFINLAGLVIKNTG